VNKLTILFLLTLILLTGIVSAATDYVVLNLTFDDTGDYFKDSSTFNQTFTAVGTAAGLTDNDICKWKGCLNLSADGGDYIQSTASFNMSYMAIAYWVYYEVQPGESETQAAFEISISDRLRRTAYSSYCYNPSWQAAGGEISTSTSSDGCVDTDRWYFVFEQYNGSVYKIYLKGGSVNFTKSLDAANGILKHNITDTIHIGEWDGRDILGYMDEVIIWNRGNFTTSEVEAIYDAKVSGTPPQLDLIVENLSVSNALNTMYDFSQVNNTLNSSGTIPFTYTIKNTGDTNTSGDFNTTLYIDGVTICQNTTSLAPGATATYTCQVNKTAGFIKGNITVDSENAINESQYTAGSETNNYYRIHYDFRTHPKLVSEINMSYVTTPGSNPAYTAYDWHKSFVSADWDSGYTADSVDPYGKKSYENAINCYLNGYDSASACQRARNHLEGWLVNTTGWGLCSVQAAHELEWVAKTYDLMFNNFTEAEALTYSVALLDVCKEVYGMSNVRPDLDSELVGADNGFGFGSGMAFPCLAVLGEVSDNPSSYYYPEDSTTGVSTPYNWLDRVDRHVMGTQNGSGFVEGITYHQNYALYHVVGLEFYDQQTDILHIVDNRQGDICGRGRSMIYNYLDNTYNGATIRDDNDQKSRFVSFGDAHSYDRVGEMEIVGSSVVTQTAILCENQTIKNALLSMRNNLYSNSDGDSSYTRPIEDLYHYKTLLDEATALTDEELASTFYYEFEGAFNKYWLRDGYDYENDTVVMFDGGDKPGFGHPNAEFDLFVYALGEPFLDQPQVPFADDVRGERWHNTLSLSNSTDTGYTADATSPPFNQPYGGASNPATSTYPDGTYMPDGYRGLVNDTFGLQGLIGGARASQPYTETSPDPQRKILVYDDVILDYYDVNRSSDGLIQFNWINIYGEFTPTISGTNLSFNRTGKDKNYRIIVLNTSTALSLQGGNSTVQASKQKTGSANLEVHYGQYRHYVNATDIKTMFLHHWWEGADTTTTTKVTNSDDIGVQIGADVYLIMDTNNNGTAYGIYTTDGWSLIINSTHVGSNGASYINNGTANLALPTTPFSGLVSVGVGASTTNCLTQRGIVCDVSGCTYGGVSCIESSAVRSWGTVCNLAGCS